MWILARHSRSRPSRAQLESLLIERTVALEKLTQRLLKLQDEERRRIARNLHDVTGQTLAALKMAVAELEHRVQPDSCALNVLSEIDALAEQALQEIRTSHCSTRSASVLPQSGTWRASQNEAESAPNSTL